MGPSAIQGCNPEIQSCDISSSEDFYPSEINICVNDPVSPNNITGFEKFRSLPPFASSLWTENMTAPLAPFDYPEDQKTRESKLGPYLAAFPPSPEEKIPTLIGKTTLMTETAYSLIEVWAQLPTQVRVYLDSMNLKNSPELGVSYEVGDEQAGIPSRWHVFEINKASFASAAILGTGTLMMASLNTSANPPSPPSGGGGGRMIPPKNQPSLNVSIGTGLLGAGLIIGIDLGIRKAFPKLPSEFVLPINIGSFYGVQYLFYRIGLIKAENWGQVWKPSVASMPTMASLGLASSILLDLLGQALDTKKLSMGRDLNFIGSSLLTLGTFYALIGRASGMKFLTATGGGVAGVLGKAARFLGIPLIVGAVWRLGKQGGKSLAPHVRCGWDDENCKDNWRVWNKAESIVMQNFAVDSFGNFGGKLFLGTGLLDFFADITQVCSSNVENSFYDEQTKIQKQIYQESIDFGKWLRSNVSLMVVDSIDMKTGEINWPIAKEKIKSFYQSEVDNDPSNDTDEDTNENYIERGYDALDDTGFVAIEANEIKNLIDEEGEISGSNHDALAQLTLTEVELLLIEKHAELKRLGESIGNIIIRGNQIYYIPPQNLTSDQKERMEAEYIPLSTQVAILETAQEKLKKFDKE